MALPRPSNTENRLNLSQEDELKATKATTRILEGYIGGYLGKFLQQPSAYGLPSVPPSTLPI